MIIFKRLPEELALIHVFKGSPPSTIVGTVVHLITRPSISLYASDSNTFTERGCAGEIGGKNLWGMINTID